MATQKNKIKYDDQTHCTRRRSHRHWPGEINSDRAGGRWDSKAAVISPQPLIRKALADSIAREVRASLHWYDWQFTPVSCILLNTQTLRLRLPQDLLDRGIAQMR